MICYTIGNAHARHENDNGCNGNTPNACNNKKRSVTRPHKNAKRWPKPDSTMCCWRNKYKRRQRGDADAAFPMFPRGCSNNNNKLLVVMAVAVMGRNRRSNAANTSKHGFGTPRILKRPTILYIIPSLCDLYILRLVAPYFRRSC